MFLTSHGMHNDVYSLTGLQIIQGTGMHMKCTM